jgi:hypothetical protein
MSREPSEPVSTGAADGFAETARTASECRQVGTDDGRLTTGDVTKPPGDPRPPGGFVAPT